MSTQLPAPLADVTNRYQQLLHQLDAGTIDANTAQGAFAQLATVDADGFRWRPSPHHDPGGPWLRARPDIGEQPANPAEFALQPTTPTPAPSPAPAAQTSFEPADTGGGFDDLFTAPPNPGPTTAPGAPPLSDPNIPILVPQENVATAPTLPLKDRAIDHAGRLLDTKAAAAISHNRRTVIVAAICTALLLGVVAFRTKPLDTDKPDNPAGPATIDCGIELPDIAGIPDPTTEALLACLDGTPNPDGTGPLPIGDPGAGPLIAATFVTTGSGAGPTFDPGGTVTRAQLASAAVKLLVFNTGQYPEGDDTADLSAVPEELQGDVQAAVHAALIAGDDLRPTEPATRGDLALIAAAVHSAAGGQDPTQPPVDAADAPEGSAAAAQATLAALGIADTAPGEAYRFDDPATNADVVATLGRLRWELENPGTLEPAP